MKILVVSQYFWPEDFRINEVVASLVEAGHEVQVLTGKPNYPAGKFYAGYRGWGCPTETHAGMRITRVPLIARASGGLRLGLNYLSFIVSGVLCGPWLLRGARYDVILVHGMSPILQALPALLMGRLKGCPVVLWVQDLWPESLAATGYVTNRRVLSAVESVVRFIYRHVDLLLVQSQAFVGPVQALAATTPVRYYPNSVDASFADAPHAPAPAVAGLGNGFSVMFAGNLGTAQAVEVIVAAAALLRDHPEIRFVVLGDGSRRAWMDAEIARLGLCNIHMAGRLPVSTMPSLMQQADVLLVTLADKPIFAATVPNKVQAYMAAGRPILACLRGEGARLVVEAGAGLEVAVEDPQALAAAVLQLHAMAPGERETMGQNGRRFFKAHFDHNYLVAQLGDHLRSVTEIEKHP
jgi:glycosyltransferase involved in cell wall biosynthesis